MVIQAVQSKIDLTRYDDKTGRLVVAIDEMTNYPKLAIPKAVAESEEFGDSLCDFIRQVQVRSWCDGHESAQREMRRSLGIEQ